MPVALIVALVTSLGAHALALFVPEIDLATVSDPLPVLLAEVKPPPLPPSPVTSPAPAAKPVAKPAAKGVVKDRLPQHRVKAPVLALAEAARPTEPTELPLSAAEAVTPPEPMPEPAGETLPVTAPAAATLPARGVIRYRVDRGDQGFAIGFSVHQWEVSDGAYRITAVTETSGLIAFFKPLRIEVESRGRLTAAGLVPEHFETRREGRATSEKVEFDWETMEVRIGDRPAQTLSVGAQDLLSYPYQLGLVADLAAVGSLPIATGKKYANFRLEVLADEDLEIPAGNFRSLHLRVPGVATTELWLAYDRALLPVKIQHLDRKGNLYVQVATTIEFSQEP
ncbi:MAG: DUF3108 domain-containing protein [Candidatus Accumulibacter sp. UW26]|jgi:hypothetical protein